MSAGRREILGEDLERAIAGYQNGLSYAALGRELGCTPLRVKRALTDAGIELRTASKSSRQSKRTAEPESRETENFEVEEPPRPKAAPVDKLDKKRDKARSRPADKKVVDADLITEDEVELEEGLAAYDAGVDDEGHIDRILALAAKLRRGGKLSGRKYTQLVDSILDQEDEPVRELRSDARGEGRRSGGRPEPSYAGVQAAKQEEGRSQLQGVAEPQDSRLRPSGDNQCSPVVSAPPRADALSAVLANYKGR